MKYSHELTWQDAALELGTDVTRGLTREQLSQAAASSTFKDPSATRLAAALFLGQWKGSVILILSASALAFWLLGHRNDAIGIFASVLFAVALGFITDFRSQRALAALKSLASPTAMVTREGVVQDIPTGELVKGDIVHLRTGNTVPADGRIYDAQNLSIQESLLTGESAACSKRTDALDAQTALAERANMAYEGTTVVSGAGKMIVTAVGSETEMGRIGTLVHSYGKEETPLERAVEKLGRRLALLVILLSAAVTLVGLLFGQSFIAMLETGFLLAIAAIPEGLPAIYTVALAGGVRRMVQAQTLVRRLSAVEVLGCVDVICTDKTGTLTENVMRAAAVSLPGRLIEVTGSGYAPDGVFSIKGQELNPAQDPGLQKLLWVGCLCNNAVLESHEGWHIHGTPTEGALLTLAVQGGLDPEKLKSANPRLSESAFTSERKRMGVVIKDAEGRTWSLVKGAVASVLPLCSESLTQQDRESLGAEAERLGSSGLRVLAFAYRELADSSGLAEPQTNLLWVGMAGLMDPPRRTAASSILALSRAGVRTVIVTGDQKATARAIAERIGLPSDESSCQDAAQLQALLASKSYEALEKISIFTRVSPEDKLKLVLALKERGHVVAMTGDGINDAPALKASDIAIAMGSGSSDVAKEASDLVVTDGNYATLTAAVDEGRKIYANLRRAIQFLLLCSLANIALMLGAVVMQLPLTLTPLQILWLNLVVHIFPGIALAVAPNSRKFMDDPPRPKDLPLLSWPEIAAIAPMSLLVAAAAFLVYAAQYKTALPLARTSALTALALGLLLQMFPALAQGRPAWSALRCAGAAVWLALGAGLLMLLAMLYWPYLNQLLQTSPLTPAQWRAPLFAAAAALALVEVWRYFARARS